MDKWERVVVGVDGSEGSRLALRAALEQAREHDATLTVVTSWTEQVVAGAPGYVAYGLVSEADLSAVAKQQQADALTSVLGDEPTPRLDQQVVEGHAARELVAAAHGADLVVVGSRGHGGFVGLLLGSVSQYVAAHAPCPVLVVR
ncbi:universal stress protein [Microlunatus antarcticus]|uniref:Nucleotide-binding universal stress UspA family protein n=1 Tax=Microlunatus antarcticus TaxID=53388 RepID=A0A7W5JVQ7_9ACTN|nr:universal stress protein [Microlunatus antarcticus]MBB3327237.1 nucleotide-binding universal stress UspA family protein [Microlunatus antarcticus]